MPLLQLKNIFRFKCINMEFWGGEEEELILHIVFGQKYNNFVTPDTAKNFQKHLALAVLFFLYRAFTF